jgi:serine/threonine protein phosphatase 1
MSVAAFGDVHGLLKPLEGALLFALDSADEVVGLGDYVNKGPDSRAVLELLLKASATAGARLSLLRGNHEEELLHFIDGGSFARFARIGGLRTIASYVDPRDGEVADRFRTQFPSEHLDLLRSMPSFMERDGVLLSHVGFDPTKPRDRSVRSTTTGNFPRLFELNAKWPQPLTVTGHYTQRSRRPFVSEHLISIDTGCGTLPGGQLTVLDVSTRTYQQFASDN